MTNVRKRCPFCLARIGSTGSRENISVSLDEAMYFCWRCGARGRVTYRIAKLLDLSEHEFSGDLTAYTRQEKSHVTTRYPSGFTALYPCKIAKNSFALEPYLKYLENRGVTHDVLLDYTIGVVLNPPYEQRWTTGHIVFPILDDPNLGYVLHNPRNKRYINSKGLSKKAAFYNGRVLQKPNETVYVVEGVFDALALAPNAVATLGSSVTDAQLDRLAEAPVRVVWALDGDAWKQARIYARRLLLRGKPSSFIRLPAGRDPGDLGYDFVSKQQAIDVS